MQLYSRILVNLLVKLTRILVISVDLLVKPNWKEPQGQRGGGHGAWAPRGWTAVLLVGTV